MKIEIPPKTRRIARVAVRVAIGCLAAVVLLLVGAVAALEIAGAVGTFPKERLARRDESVRVLARDGSALWESLSRGAQRARWVTLEEISPRVVEAVLAAEDARFFEHAGVDYRAFARALWYAVKGRRSGGSTITQQLVKLLDRSTSGAATRRRSLSVKLSEVVDALRLERVASKAEILREYLNRAPFGTRESGVESASWSFFRKPARELSVAEAALLAAMPKGPTYYDPRAHPKRAKMRRDWVLHRMRALGRIDDATLALALAEPLRIEPRHAALEAPHVSLAVAKEARGPEVRTSIDPRLQRIAEAAVRRTVEELGPRGVGQASAIVIENRSGQVLAYVGSRSWRDDPDGRNDGVRARRQPGSALKPFAYALAFEGDATPATLLRDLPTRFSTTNGEYSPRNYDGRFHGPVLARAALANSYNVPAVLLAHRLSPGTLLARLRAMGFESLSADEDHYGLGVVLGNGEVTLWELARAYLALARGGERIEPSLTAATAPKGDRVLSPESVYLVTHVLSDAHARQAAFGERSALDLPFTAAVKTGTSTDFRDNWTAGYTSEVTVAVWVGNFSGRPMRSVSGVTGAAPLWNELIAAAMEGRPRESFVRPAGIVGSHVCPRSGKLPGPHCDGARFEVFRAGTEPKGVCSIHDTVEIDRHNGLLAGPACAARDRSTRVVERYDADVEPWAIEAARPLAPRAYSPRCPAPITNDATTARRIEIRAPRDGDVFTLLPDVPRRAQRLRLEARVEGHPRKLRWLANGRPVAVRGFPYDARFRLEPGEHEIVAEADGVRSDPVRVTVQP
jgi:penicillin-binding protein 1C